MLLVGLTGGIGAGKSTVARLLSAHGAIVIDADQVARDAIAPGTHGFEQVRDLLGDEVVGPSGELDRAAVARLVFGDEGKRRALESITHPEVFRRLAETVQEHQGTDRVVVFDAALLVETGFHEACDVVIVVTAPEEERVRRVMLARGMEEAEARSRIAAQAGAAELEAAADVILPNEGDLEHLAGRVEDVWGILRARAG